MDEAGDLHPLGLPIPANRLRGLQKVLYLREAGLEEQRGPMSAPAALPSKDRRRRLTSGSESSTSVFSFSIASQMPAGVVSPIWRRRSRRRELTHTGVDRALELRAHPYIEGDRLLLCKKDRDSDLSGRNRGGGRGRGGATDLPCCSR